MRKFTKFFFALLVLCCMAGVQSVNAATEKAYADFKNATETNAKIKWTENGEFGFTWPGRSYNQIRNVGLPKGDITGYSKLVIDCTIEIGGAFRILFYKGNDNKTLWVEKSGVTEFDLELSGIPEDYLTECTEICLSGPNWDKGEETGSVIIHSFYLETADNEAGGNAVKQLHATFANPTGNENTTWDATSKTFAWTTTYGNQLRNIGLPNGDITKFKKLVVDCTLGENTQNFRILVYQGGANQTLTVTKSGVTEFNLKNTIAEEFLKNCTEICLSGSQASGGSAVINDVYLETYPEGESFDDIMLTPGMFQNWDGVGADAQSKGAAGGVANYEVQVNSGGVIYGFGHGGVPETSYADLTGCSKMIVKGTPGMGVRTMWNRAENEGAYIEWIEVIDEDGIIEFDLQNGEKLKDCKYLHLNAIKEKNGNAGIIDYITFDGDFELVVVDGKNFTPNFKEYNTASYERTFNTAYTYGTICLPFAPDAATCENYTFYKLDQASANTLMFVEEEAPKANTAYLYRPKDATATTHAFTGGETTVSTEVAASTSGDWSFIGSLKNATIDLTANGSFYAYKPDANNGENKISKATSTMSVKPYRAYFHYTGTGNAVATMRVIVRGDGTTGIEEVITPDQIESVAPATIYNLMGQPVAQPVKGQIYIVNGKKVVY